MKSLFACISSTSMRCSAIAARTADQRRSSSAVEMAVFIRSDTSTIRFLHFQFKRPETLDAVNPALDFTGYPTQAHRHDRGQRDDSRDNKARAYRKSQPETGRRRPPRGGVTRHRDGSSAYPLARSNPIFTAPAPSRTAFKRSTNSLK